ncbi:acyltransferase family protein [Rhodococcus gannanensis]|uniref:Acyltransferase family protein n=1 Tax=Rhodococcus gannanensis TaxID=1960308 RepID=A0ABW4NXD8_9NOCA
MRAVAVLAVFVNHLFGWPSGGFVGVDIFFVLSGFFITALLIRERTETGSLSFSNFYIRRVRRIIPAALLVIAVTVVAGYIVFPAQRAKETLLDGLCAALFGANWRFESVGTDYFQQGQPPSPLQHYWSLSIEEQFYFVWPALLLALFLVTRRAARRGRAHIRTGVLAAGMGSVVLISFTWSVAQSGSSPASAYFSTLTRVWELGVGALVAILGPLLAKLPSRGPLRPTLAYAGLAGVAASLFLITETTQFPGPGAALPVMATAVVVASFHGADVRAMPILTNPVAQYFGKVSYSLYLWHWPVIVVLAVIVPPGAAYHAIAATLALLLSHVSFTYFEDRIRRSTWLERPTEVGHGRTIATIRPGTWRTTGFVAAAAMLSGLIGIQLSDRAQRVGEEYESLYVAQSAQFTAPEDPCLGAGTMADPNCAATVDLDLMKPSLDSFAKDTQGAYSCWRQQGGSMPRCVFGSTEDDALKVALVGDSHAAMLLPALSEFLVSENWNLTAFVGYDCQWATSPNDDCGDVMQTVQNRLLTDEPYDVILTTASRKYGNAADYASAWSPVAARGTKIVVVADNPTVTESALECLTRFGAEADDIAACGMTMSEGTGKADPLIAAAGSVPGASVVDLTDLYCADGRCPAVIGNVVVYRDTGGHISATFSRSLSHHLEDRIDAARSTD